MKPVLIGISPNTSKKEVMLAARLLLSPNQWLDGLARQKLENKFKAYFQAQAAFGLNTGRAALWLALKALGLKPGDEVLTQAFSCVVVANAIKHAGGRPVFVDIEANSFNVSVKDLKAKITPRTRAIVVQHLFGYPDDLKTIKQLCQQHNLVLIEDCAQALGATYAGRPVGEWGDLAIFSFGRDKMISSLNGGMLIVNNSKFLKPIKAIYSPLSQIKRGEVVKSLLYPLVMGLIKPTYFWPKKSRITLGKLILFICQKIKLIERPVQLIELEVKRPSNYVAKLSNALALMAQEQFNNLNWNLSQRLKTAKVYEAELNGFKPNFDQQPSYLRWPMLVKQPQKLIQTAKLEGIFLGNWYRQVIAPAGVNFKAVGYDSGSCLQAEKKAKQVINLPTYPYLSNNQIKAVIRVVKNEIN